jgi:endonuclease-3
VGRLSRKLALSEDTNADKVERDLMELVPKSEWTLWAHLLIYHGRAVCNARKPACADCVLIDLCPSAEI